MPVIYHSFLPMHSVVWGILIDLVSPSAAALRCSSAYLQKERPACALCFGLLVAAELMPSASVT